LEQILASEEHTLTIVVTAVPDERRGERIVVLYTHLNKTPQEVCEALQKSGLPNLWIPSPDSFAEVPEIPVLGTGKLDLQGVKRLALERFADHA
jgi:acyl-[acyl-carrier-protein]-phospholipid O-acyltransferase/long-chain-fatty-acid--[acyl-carrier-protein] ligase